MKKDKKKMLTKWSTKKPLYIDKKDKRYKHHMKQLKKTGLSSTECWSLCSVISEFTLPRLKLFRKDMNGFPSEFSDQSFDSIGNLDDGSGKLSKKAMVKANNKAFKKWRNVIDDMIFAHGKIVDDNWHEWSKKDNIRITRGLDAFHKYYQHLWW